MSETASASSQPDPVAVRQPDRRIDDGPSTQRVRKDADPVDRALIARAQRADVGAFNELVQRYEKSVYNFAYRLSGNYDNASDIAQDAFIRAYNAIHSFRGDASFSTWLFRITTNVFLDERKKARAHPQQSLDEYLQVDESSSVARQVEDPSPTPEVIATDKEKTAVLAAAIAALPEYQRVMVVMYHMEQKAYEEIAEIMDLPIGTVKSRLNRARLALKEKLSDQRELLGI